MRRSCTHSPRHLLVSATTNDHPGDVEPQERDGIKILSAYRTLEDENLFVWSRQFSSKANMPKERAAFYESDQWKKVLYPELKQNGLVPSIGRLLAVLR